MVKILRSSRRGRIRVGGTLRGIVAAGRREIASNKNFTHALCVAIQMKKCPRIGRRLMMWGCAWIWLFLNLSLAHFGACATRVLRGTAGTPPL